jgi:uncharacterized protein
MKILTLSLLLLLPLFASSVANAASFDCTKASTKRERLICHTPELSADDARLGAVYIQMLGALPPEAAALEKQLEREWLRSLDEDCPADRSDDVVCLDQKYKERIGKLSNDSVRDALVWMVRDPVGAAAVFRRADSDLAKLGLAMDMRLILPNPEAHKDQIGALLNSILPADYQNDLNNYSTASYDGSVQSLVPYILVESFNADGAQLPLSCDLIVKFPVLLESTVGGFGSSKDGMVPQIDCNDSRYAPDNGTTQYADTLRGLSDLNEGCGGTEVFGAMTFLEYENWVVYLLPAAMMDTTRYDGPNSAYLRKQHKSLIGVPTDIPSDPQSIPLASWMYTSPDAYLKGVDLAQKFLAARAALAHRYETLFGFSSSDADIAAQTGVWVLDGAAGWARDKDDADAADPLAKAILTGQPAPALVPLLKNYNADGNSGPDYLVDAVLDPAAIPLLLQQGADVNAADDDGVTALMEAALHDRLDALNVLLAAKANVNAVTAAQDRCENVGDGTFMGDAPNPGLYPPPPAGETALMYAAGNASLAVIRRLVTAGADKSAIDGNGETALAELKDRIQYQAFLSQRNLPSTGAVPLSPADAEAAQRLLSP